MEKENKQFNNDPNEVSFSSSVISTTSASTIKEPSKVDYNALDYISFGTDNLFPQGLAILNRRASTHRSILNNKVIYSLGRGFITEGNVALENFIKQVNNNRESLRKVLKKIFNDYYSFGNAYLEVVLVDNGQPQFYHHDATKVRIHKERTHVIIHPDWKQYEGKKMFATEVYIKRRKRLREQVGSGLILLLGNEESPMNYPDNQYPFRQDSTFLYFFGLDYPGLAAFIDIDEDNEYVFGNDPTADDIIWMGPQPSLKEKCEKT